MIITHHLMHLYLLSLQWPTAYLSVEPDTLQNAPVMTSTSAQIHVHTDWGCTCKRQTVTKLSMQRFTEQARDAAHAVFACAAAVDHLTHLLAALSVCRCPQHMKVSISGAGNLGNLTSTAPDGQATDSPSNVTMPRVVTASCAGRRDWMRDAACAARSAMLPDLG